MIAPSPTWTVFTNGLHGGWVSSMAVDPVDRDVAYLTYSNFGIPHVLKSVNGGTDWLSIDGISASGIPDIPAHWVALRPCEPEQVFVGTELGLFASDDGGGTWQPANSGLPHTVVESLTFQDDDTLVAYTFGRGAFVAKLAPCCGVTSFCTAKVTSTGSPAALVHVGSASFTSADFQLVGNNGGVGPTLGIHIYSDTGPAATPFSNATLCLAPPVLRGPTHQYDTFGLVVVPIPITANQIGTRRLFQLWFRDTAHPDGTGVGLSDALDVTFCP